MRVGISADAYRKILSTADSVRRIAGLGFDAIDLDYLDWCFETSPAAGDDWRAWVAEIETAARESGISFSQAHAPIYPPLDDRSRDEFLDLMTERMFSVCATLGIPWAVFHARFPSGGYVEGSRSAIREENVRWFRALADRAAESEVSVAVENLYDFDQGTWKTYPRDPDDLLGLLDEIDRPNLGACLDTGHAHIAGHEPAEYARALGDRLAVLHIHDNDGRGDQHIAPFTGYIDWPAFMAALREIGYRGVLSLELHHYLQRLPPEIIDDAARVALSIGRHLTQL